MTGMVPEDVFEMRWAEDPRVSPDGTTAAYTVTRVDRDSNDYRSSIWMAPIDGAGPPRRFTSGTSRDASPIWSPDGTRLAFTSKRGGETMQLHVIPVAGGEPVKLTDLQEDVTEVAWSPDGSRLAFTSRVRDAAYDEQDERKRPPRRIARLQYKLDNVGWTIDRPKRLFVVPAEGSGPPTQLLDGDFEEESPAWSPDGSRIAFDSARQEDWDLSHVHDVYVVDSQGGEPERITPGDGWYSRPSWSPDGARIACLFVPGIFDDPRHGQVAVVPAAGGVPRILTGSLDRNCQPYPPPRGPAWDGEDLLFLVEDHGSQHVYRVPADGGEPRVVVGGEVTVKAFDVAGGRLVHAASVPTALTEIFVGDRRLSDAGRAFADGRELIPPERFVAVSRDGTEVEAWVMRPAGIEPGHRYPAVVNIHGGPFSQYGNTFFDEFQIYAGGGYAVVFSNPRGSSGYDEAWGRAIRGPATDGPGWGSVDYEDVMAVTEEAARRFDFIDPNRMGVMGGSYGGYLTSWIVGHTDRFRAAVSERAVNQWVSMYGASDFGWDFAGYIGAFLHENFDAWVRMSPATYAKDITTPLLILHSENDLRCPIEQAEQLFTTLRLLKREVEMVRFPVESHELSRSGSPAHRVMRFELILDWWERHLRKD